MDVSDNIKLENIDAEEIGDILVSLDKSFKTNLPKDAFKDAKTFGDLCDVFEQYTVHRHIRDCTTQQAFYKIRVAIALAQAIDKNLVTPRSKLEDLFPRSNRRKQVQRFKKHLSIPVDFLGIKNSISWVLFFGVVLSMVAFFFSWLLALSGLVFFILTGTLAGKLGIELKITTVGQLADLLSRKYYYQ